MREKGKAYRVSGEDREEGESKTVDLRDARGEAASIKRERRASRRRGE